MCWEIGKDLQEEVGFELSLKNHTRSLTACSWKWNFLVPLPSSLGGVFVFRCGEGRISFLPPTLPSFFSSLQLRQQQETCPCVKSQHTHSILGLLSPQALHGALWICWCHLSVVRSSCRGCFYSHLTSCRKLTKHLISTTSLSLEPSLPQQMRKVRFKLDKQCTICG